MQLEVELLKMEKRSADVTHRFYLGERGDELGVRPPTISADG